MVVSEKVEEYGRAVEAALEEAGLRVIGRLPGGKDRGEDPRRPTGTDPLHVRIGGREAEAGQVAVRDRLEGDLGAMPVEAAMAEAPRGDPAKTSRRGETGAGQGRG